MLQGGNRLALRYHARGGGGEWGRGTKEFSVAKDPLGNSMASRETALELGVGSDAAQRNQEKGAGFFKAAPGSCIKN